MAQQCVVCNWDDTDNILFGEWKNARGLSVHYFCLLSGSELPQRGKDNEGILGFLPIDIVESVQKLDEAKCHYCGLKSAAVKCAEKDCDRRWHYPCGTRNSCMSQFTGEFKSFCNRHVPDPNRGKKHGYEYCLVCLEVLESYHPATSIISSCCLQLDDWNKCFVHKKCVTNYAKVAGYDSMCINCPMDNGTMTKTLWQEEMRRKGIFIPMQDAVWEQDGSFRDQVKRKCLHPTCPYPGASKDVWTCFVCGCYPSHLKCAQVMTFEEYYCPKCYDQSFVQRVPKLL